MRKLFYYKMRQSLLQNAPDFLLENATVLLQNATVIINCDDFITKCGSYYKIRCLLQIATDRTATLDLQINVLCRTH